MCWSFLYHARFLILLTVFELLPKTCNFTICSIFSNNGHVGWCTASPDTILKLDTLVMIWPSLVSIGLVLSEEKIFEKVYDVRRTADGRRRRTADGRRRRTPSDGNSSHDPLGSGELKIYSDLTFSQYNHILVIFTV
jgi:hypothetical protein